MVTGVFGLEVACLVRVWKSGVDSMIYWTAYLSSGPAVGATRPDDMEESMFGDPFLWCPFAM